MSPRCLVTRTRNHYDSFRRIPTIIYQLDSAISRSFPAPHACICSCACRRRLLACPLHRCLSIEVQAWHSLRNIASAGHGPHPRLTSCTPCLLLESSRILRPPSQESSRNPHSRVPTRYTAENNYRALKNVALLCMRTLQNEISFSEPPF